MDTIEVPLPAQQDVRGRLNDVFGGAVCSVLSISYCLSYAALIFSGPLTPWLGHGISITFISAAMLAAIAAIGSSLPIMIAGPDSSTSAVVATLSAALAEHMLATNPAADLLGPTAITLAVVTASTGVFMLLLGALRGGRAIRYVPYPVIGGFLGATGWLIVGGAVRVTTGFPLSISSWGTLTHGVPMRQLLACAAVALVIALVMRRVRTAQVLPVLLVGGVIVAHVGFQLAGMSLHDAQASGWTFMTPTAQQLALPWTGIGPIVFPWSALPSIAGDAVAVVLVTALTALVNTTGIEVAIHREADLERELQVTGLANLASAAAGGFVGCNSISRTVLSHTAGATGRLSGLTVAVTAALVVLAGPTFLGYVPKFVLGGLLLYLGVDQLHRWVVASWPRLSRTEYVSLLAIIVIIVQMGFVWGILIGTVIGCATFAFTASRVNSIKYEFDGSELRSTLDRDRHDLAVLAANGREIIGLNLQSYLFFGSANRLYRHVKALLAAAPQCRFLVFDFRLVTGIDSSATYSFAQIKRYAAEHGVRLVFVHLSAAAQKAFRAEAVALADVTIHAELDHALEWCENEVIRSYRTAAAESGDLRDWFTEVLGSAAHAEDLLRRCRRLEIEPDAVIARAGDAADSMYFILTGRVGVMVETGDGRSVRVRSLGRHTMIGEMGLLTRQPRSATIQAEIASVLYELDGHAFAQLKQDNPQLVERLLSYVVAVLAERLAFANRAIGVLRR